MRMMSLVAEPEAKLEQIEQLNLNQCEGVLLEIEGDRQFEGDHQFALKKMINLKSMTMLQKHVILLQQGLVNDHWAE